MDGWWLAFRLFVLLAIANSAPIATKRLLGERWDHPLDGGRLWKDGRPVLGRSKTIRGVVAALAACAVVAPLLALPVQVGLIAAAGAMVGDALASFAKRRIGIAPSGRAFGLDQVPEALLPLVILRGIVDLGWLQVAAITLAFLLAERPAAWLSWRVGLRDEPY